MSTTLTLPSSGVDQIGSDADMMSTFQDAGLFDESSSADTAVESTGESEEVAADPTITDPGAPGDGEEVASEQDPEQVASEAAAAEEAAPPPVAAPTSNLPEGVTAGKQNGKNGYFVEGSRWERSIYPNHQLMKEVSSALGEPATLETLKAKITDSLDLDMIYGDLTSGEANTQSKVFNHFFDRADAAYKSGETTVDPSVGMAQAFYDTLKQRSPDGYATLRVNQFRELAAEAFEAASKTNDLGLFHSAQNLVAWLAGSKDPVRVAEVARQMNIPYYEPSQMRSVVRQSQQAPMTALQRENEVLRARLQGKNAPGATDSFSQWHSQTADVVKKAFSEEGIAPAIASEQKAWEKFPDDFRRLVQEPLEREVAKNMKTDPVFQDRLKIMDERARRAAPEKRQSIRDSIKAMYTNRAKLVADELKGPILQFAATALKDRSSSTHTRLNTAQSQTAPKGATSSRPQSLVPPSVSSKNGSANWHTSDDIVNDMVRLLG